MHWDFESNVSDFCRNFDALQNERLLCRLHLLKNEIDFLSFQNKITCLAGPGTKINKNKQSCREREREHVRVKIDWEKVGKMDHMSYFFQEPLSDCKDMSIIASETLPG